MKHDNGNPFAELFNAAGRDAEQSRQIEHLTKELAQTKSLVEKLRVNLNKTVRQVQELTKAINALESKGTK